MTEAYQASRAVPKVRPIGRSASAPAISLGTRFSTSRFCSAIVLGALLGWLFPALRPERLDQGARRRLRQTHPDGDRADHLLHGGLGHRPHQRSEESRPRRVKALFYFEIVSTFALVLGLLVANVLHPGAGFSGQANASAVAGYVKQASEMKSVDFVLHIIPDSAVGAFAAGDILQVLLFSVLFGFALMALGESGHRLRGSSTTWPTRYSASSPSSSKRRRSARSAPWPTPSAVTGRDARQPRRTGRDLLFDIGAVRCRRARHHRQDRRLLDLPLSRLHQGRTADRAGHQFVGKRAAAVDGKAGAARLLQVGGRAGGADRLFVQSRRHQHLHDAGDAVYRPGTQCRPHASASR